MRYILHNEYQNTRTFEMMNIGKQPDPEIHEGAIQRAFVRSMGNSFQIMIPNYYTPDNLGYEADMFCIRKSRYTVEVEVKISIFGPMLHKRKLDPKYDQGIMTNLSYRYLSLWSRP
nr:MAG: DNA repair protein MmcB-like protein [Bacteriophage sp.]